MCSGLGADADCGPAFVNHLRQELFPTKEDASVVPTYLLRKDFDYVQRLVLLEGISGNLRKLVEYSSKHPLAPMEEQVVELLLPSLQETPSLLDTSSPGALGALAEAYANTSAALHHHSLVSKATIPDLHRLVLLCPYFLPLISIGLRAASLHYS